MRNDLASSTSGWAGVEVGADAPTLAVETCLARLAHLGITPEDAGPTGPGSSSLVFGPSSLSAGCLQAGVECEISWYGPAAVPAGQPGSEAAVQALSGLMQVHGRDAGRPRRLGLEIASVAAGVLAAHGVLAALIAQSRGRLAPTVRTSVLQAGLLQASHYIAAATCPLEWTPARPGPAPGPPFATADARWFEIETFDPEAWRSFWSALGAPEAELGQAWTLFRSRYYQGECSLPVGLHEATSGHALGETTRVAEAFGVSLTPLRGYTEVLVEPGRAAAYPVLEQFQIADASPRRPTVFDMARGSSSDLPLEGMRVIEATSRLQGPLAGLLLQMLGAEVTRIEPPGGDFGRMVPPLAGDTGSFFLCFNRGKKSLELDLAKAAGRSQLVELVARADVFLHNWRPGKAEQWSLGGDDLARHNQGLVYAEASGWGESAHASQLIGTDFLVQAYAGLGSGLNPEGEPPAPSRVLLTDFMGALVACEGILAGLYQREKTGQGCRARTSLVGGAMTLQSHVLSDLARGEETVRRQGRPVWGPLDRPVETRDGFIALTVENDESLRRLCEICGMGQDNGGHPAVQQQLVGRLRERPTAYWEELLLDAGIPCAAVCTELDRLPHTPRLAELFEPLAGTAWAPAAPWRFG